MAKRKMAMLIMMMCCICLTACGNSKDRELEEMTEENDPVQFSESSTGSNSGRPGYYASDYAELPEITDIEVADVQQTRASNYLVESQIKKLCRYNGIDYTDPDSLTNEDAAILSGQKYQNADDFISGMWDQVENYLAYKRNEDIYSEVLRNMSADIGITSLPEATLEYDLSEDTLKSLAASMGYSDEEIESVFGEDADEAGLQELQEEAEMKLYAEVLQKAIQEKYGIESPTDESWNILMYKNACISRDDLYDLYTEDDLMNELLYIDIADYIAEHVNVYAASADTEG